MCDPRSCSAEQLDCGSIPDGCGATLECGTCRAGAVCGLQSPNVCAERPCEADGCDRFDRDLSAGLGQSTSGAAWWTEDAASSRVEGGLGILQPPPSRARHARLSFAPSTPNYSVAARILWADPATQQAYVVARMQDDAAEADQYMAGWNGSAWVIRRREGGELSAPLVTFSGEAPLANRFHHVELDVKWEVLRMRAWPEGAPPPATWAEVKDDAITSPGAAGLRAYTFAAADPTHAVAFDDLEVRVTPPGTGAVVLDMDFDSGSLDVANSTVTGTDVVLRGRDNGNAGQWKWIYFRASNVRGKPLAFSIGSNFASGSARLTNHRMVYSYDQKNWLFFDNNALGGATFAFSNVQPFELDRVYVAYGLPYPWSDVLAQMAEVKSSPWVKKTSSGTADFVVGSSAGGTDDLGRAIPPHPLYGFRISDDSAPGPKKKVVLVGGVHSNETTGSHALEGLVDFLLGSTAEASALRKKAEFFVYPMINPDGRFAGYNRHTVERVGEDPNRQWAASGAENWLDNREIREAAQAMVADTDGDVDYLLDFHSTVGTSRHFAYLDSDGSPTGLQMDVDPFWVAVLAREPLVTVDATYVGRTTMRFGWTALNAEFASTIEMYFRPGENVSRYRQIGERMGLAFYDALAAP